MLDKIKKDFFEKYRVYHAQYDLDFVVCFLFIGRHP